MGKAGKRYEKVKEREIYIYRYNIYRYRYNIYMKDLRVRELFVCLYVFMCVFVCVCMYDCV